LIVLPLVACLCSTAAGAPASASAATLASENQGGSHRFIKLRTPAKSQVQVIAFYQRALCAAWA
jgi:hypothetical protein